MSKKPRELRPFSMTEQFEAAQESAVASPAPPRAADFEKRETYVIPPGHTAVLDEEGRATGAVELEAPGSTWTRPLAESDPIGESLEEFHSSPGSMGQTPKPGDAQWKDNNPKAAFGAAKVGIDYLSFPVLLEQSVGMMAGGYKYGAHNYLTIAPSVMTYIAAAFRHMAAYVGGEEFDPHAGEGVIVHHLTAAQNCLHVVRAAQINGNFFDDRPPSMPPGFIEELAKSVVALQKNNPDPVARYLRDGKRGPGRQL